MVGESILLIIFDDEKEKEITFKWSISGCWKDFPLDESGKWVNKNFLNALRDPCACKRLYVKAYNIK